MTSSALLEGRVGVDALALAERTDGTAGEADGADGGDLSSSSRGDSGGDGEDDGDTAGVRGEVAVAYERGERVSSALVEDIPVKKMAGRANRDVQGAVTTLLARRSHDASLVGGSGAGRGEGKRRTSSASERVLTERSSSSARSESRSSRLVDTCNHRISSKSKLGVFQGEVKNAHSRSYRCRRGPRRHHRRDREFRSHRCRNRRDRVSFRFAMISSFRRDWAFGERIARTHRLREQ